jgi:hypothetical protein
MIEHRPTIQTRVLHSLCIICACLVAGCAAHRPDPVTYQKPKAIIPPVITFPQASMRRTNMVALVLPPAPATLHGCAWDWNPTNSLAGKYFQVWASNDLANWRIVTNTLWPHYLAPATQPCEFYKVCTVDTLGRRGWSMKSTP